MSGVDLAAALNPLSAQRLLLEDTGERGNTYRIPHEITRQAIENDIGSHLRRLLHWRIAEYIEATAEPAAEAYESGTSSAERLAYHFAEAGVRGKTALYLERAGDCAWRLRAHQEAARYYTTLVDYLERDAAVNAHVRPWLDVARGKLARARAAARSQKRAHLSPA